MTESRNSGGKRVFLASDRIWPSAINANYPGATFLARARTSSEDHSVAEAFAPAVTGDVWGVLVEVDAVPDSAAAVQVTTDDGTESQAYLDGSTLLDGDPESLFMAARYWELPPDFVQQLREALQARGVDTADEEPRDDGALAQAGPSGS